MLRDLHSLIGLVYTTPEEFKNGVFTLKTRRPVCFTFTLSRRNLPENATVTDHYGFVFKEKTRARKPHDYRAVIVIEKLRRSFQNVC